MIELYLNGQRVAPHASWHEAEIVVQRDEENYTLAVQLQDVVLVEDAYDFIKQAEQNLSVVIVEARIDGIAFKGRLMPHEVVYMRDHVRVRVDLDTAGDFARLVAGRLIPQNIIESFPIVVRPKVDRATVIVLIVSIFIITYITIKEIFELSRDIALLLGIAGAGVSGPISSTAAAAAIATLRALYIASLVVALVQLVREVINLLTRIDSTKGVRLGVALQAFANSAGFSVQYPSWLDNVWLVGDTIDTTEATEVFSIAKRLTRTALLGIGNQLRFVPLAGTFPQALRQAWEEGYRYNSDEVPRREIISLVRDAADSWSLSAPAAVEIDRPGMLGYKRIDIPRATGQRAGERREIALVRAFLSVLALFSRRIRNVQAQYQEAEGYLIVEREGFSEKLVYAQSKSNVQQELLLQNVQAAYSNRRLEKRFENVRMPFTAQVFQTLMAAGFAGVRSLRWKAAQGWAEITYAVETKQLNETIRII